MHCREVMQKTTRSCREWHTAQSAAIQMRDEGLGFLPVCDQEGKLRGVISERDLVRQVCAEGLDPKEARVGKIMSKEVFEFSMEDDFSDARQIVLAKPEASVVVNDAQGKLAGLIGLAELISFENGYQTDRSATCKGDGNRDSEEHITTHSVRYTAQTSR